MSAAVASREEVRDLFEPKYDEVRMFRAGGSALAGHGMSVVGHDVRAGV